MAVGRNYRVYHKHIEGAPYSLFLENVRNSDEFLLFESNVVASLVTKECEEFRKQYTKLLDGYGCLGVLQLHGNRGGLTQYLCMITACVSVGKIGECDVLRITAVQFLPMWAPLPSGVQGSLAVDERVIEIQKLISSGTFYFTWSARIESLIDLSVCAQKRHEGQGPDNRFFWNRTLHSHLQRYGVDSSKWLLRCICGGVDIKTVYVGHKTAKACLISRLSCERMGTRFNVRGVNDDGHVANFVETEQVIFYDDQIVSFVQTRGSVPLFWEQPGVQVGSHKIKMCRGFEASAPAYDRHLKVMKRYYGDVVVVNLLGNKEGEKVLSQLLKTHHESSVHNGDTPFVVFDYHALVRANNRPQNLIHLWDKVKDHCHRFGFFHASGPQVQRVQSGVIRTNCLDCLDRTNSAQAFFAFQILSLQLQSLSLSQTPNYRSRFEEIYKQLWTANGDQCSKIYAGTGALEGKSKVKDASRSVTRTIQNNFMDGSKQEAMDVFLLGTGMNSEIYDRARTLLPFSIMQACPSVLNGVVERADEMTSPKDIRLFCGSWNVNGGQRFNSVVFRRDQSLSDWLLDLDSKRTEASLINVSLDGDSSPVDIFAIGLQEIVDLSASNIVSASSSNQRLWCDALRKVISRDHKYILIHSVQLVGVCLFIYIRPHLAPFIREVAADCVKTGLGGAAGNKGAVAVRFMLYSTSLCFICSHFAAGQKEVADRNNDYAEICKKVRFPMGRGVFNHDLVFWLGDFNYRIDMNGEEVKRLVKERNFQPMISADQLTVQKNIGNVFHGFYEGPLSFAPTYKYDTFSDDYDTSEKCRAPAWTDRVLWWQRPPLTSLDGQSPSTPSSRTSSEDRCTLIHYGRAELKTSDHRPVGAIFNVQVRQVDDQRRKEVFHDIISHTGPPDATVLVGVNTRPNESGFPSDLMDEVLRKTTELGAHVLLVKFVGNDMWLIFKDGDMALAALSMDGLKIGNDTLSVRLKSPQWEEECERELKQSPWMTEGDTKYDLLRDDAVQYDIEDEECDGTLQPCDSPQLEDSGSSTPVMQRSNKPPERPALPPKRPPRPIEQPAKASVMVVRGNENIESATGAIVELEKNNSDMRQRPGTIPISGPMNVKRTSAYTPEQAEAMISELQEREGSATRDFASPGDDDWCDFVQTRSVGASKFYGSAPQPDDPTDTRIWSPQEPGKDPFPPAPEAIQQPPPMRGRDQPPTDPCVIPPIPPRPTTNVADAAVNNTQTLSDSFTPPPVPARRPPPIPN